LAALLSGFFLPFHDPLERVKVMLSQQVESKGAHDVGG
jgi:hypothetical protein